MNVHHPIDPHCAKAIKYYLSFVVAGSAAGPTLDKAALYMLRQEKDSKGNNLPRSFAWPREAVLSTPREDGVQHVIGTRVSNTVNIKPTPRSSPPQPHYEPNHAGVLMRAHASRIESVLVRRGKFDELDTLGTYFGIVGDVFERGTVDEKGRTVGRLPRIWSLLHRTEPGRELLRRLDALERDDRRKAEERGSRALANPPPPMRTRRKVRGNHPEQPDSSTKNAPSQGEAYRQARTHDTLRYRVQGCSMAFLGELLGLRRENDAQGTVWLPSWLRTKLGPIDEELDAYQADRQPSGPVLADFERMRNLCFDIRKSKYRELRGLFAAAETAAQEDWQRAGDAWNAAIGGRP